MGLFGGFLLTIYLKSERKSITVDAQITSPKNFHVPNKNFDSVKKGPLSIGTPGFLKGLWEIHQKYGNISWRNLVEPTIKLCNEGMTVNEFFVSIEF
jgi:gamma-glutamyltranspeptidase / glutathione hydrolase / leukotriene-C4 hydrolase